MSLGHGVGCVCGKNIGGDSIHHVLVFVPQEGPSFLEFGKVRLNDYHSGDDSAGNEGVVGAVVAVGDELGLGSYGRNEREIRYGMGAEDVVETTQDILGSNDVRKRFVKEVHLTLKPAAAAAPPQVPVAIGPP